MLSRLGDARAPPIARPELAPHPGTGTDPDVCETGVLLARPRTGCRAVTTHAMFMGQLGRGRRRRVVGQFYKTAAWTLALAVFPVRQT